jgi:hypothetical protein
MGDVVLRIYFSSGVKAGAHCLWGGNLVRTPNLQHLRKDELGL